MEDKSTVLPRIAMYKEESFPDQKDIGRLYAIIVEDCAGPGLMNRKKVLFR